MGGRGQIGISMGTVNKLESILKKKISRVTGLIKSSLACKCIFYRLEHNAKGGPHGIEF